MERLAGTIVNALDNYLTEIKQNYSEERFDYEIDHGFLENPKGSMKLT